MAFSISLLSFSIPSTAAMLINSYAQENEKKQNLTETNIPKVLPLVRGFADGNGFLYYNRSI